MAHRAQPRGPVADIFGSGDVSDDEGFADDAQPAAIVKPPAHAPIVYPRRTFYFQHRRGTLDIRAFARLDLDKIVEDVDIDAIETHLEALTFCELTEADARRMPDDCFVKLFRLSQVRAQDAPLSVSR